jgi:hypothetical protein
VPVVLDDRDVDGAGVDLGQPLVQFDHPRDDRRVALRQGREGSPDEGANRGEEGADHDRPAHVVDHRGEIGLGLVQHPAQALTVLGQPMSERGQFQGALPTAPGAVDQREPGFAFQQCQLLRDGRGRHAQLGGGGGGPGEALDRGQDEQSARVQMHEVNLHSK